MICYVSSTLDPDKKCGYKVILTVKKETIMFLNGS